MLHKTTGGKTREVTRRCNKEKQENEFKLNNKKSITWDH